MDKNNPIPIKDKIINNIKSIPTTRKIYIIIYVILILIAIILTSVNPNNYFTTDVNISMYVSITLLFMFLYISSFYKQDNILLKKETLNIYNLRQTVFFICLITIIFLINLLVLNPFDIGVMYKNMLIILLSISLFLTLIVFISLSKYIDSSYKINGVDITTSKALWSSILQSFGLLLITSAIIGGFFLFIRLILILFQQDNSMRDSLIGKIVTYLFLFILIGLIIKYVVLKYLESLNSTSIVIKIISYIIKFLFFIPCGFILIGEYLMGEYKKTKPVDVYFFLFCIIVYFIIGLVYYFYPYFAKGYYIDGGSLLLNKPISLDTQTVITSYLQLYGDNINKNTKTYSNYYKYSISFWFYIDSYPPNTNASYNKDTIIINNGYNPFVTYNASTHTLKVSLMDVELMDKCNNSGINDDKCIDKITNTVYINKNVGLQKWNNMVLIFNSGTLDVFYNNILVKSGIGAPNISSVNPLITGSNIGLSGGICNILYFKKNISLELIDKLYNSVKDKNPPIGNYKFKI